jgi:dienelactone hydrolase
MSYTIQNSSIGGKLALIEEVNGKWKKEVEGNIEFTNDGKQAICIKNNFMQIIKLGTSIQEVWNNVESYALSRNQKHQKLAFLLVNDRHELIVRDLSTKVEQRFIHVSHYLFSEDGKILILLRKDIQNSSKSSFLEIIDLVKGLKKIIWHGQNASNFVFNKSLSQIAFISEDINKNRLNKSIWLYNQEEEKAKLLVKNCGDGTINNLSISGISSFAFGDLNLLIRLKSSDKVDKISPKMLKVDVWSYKDEKLQSEQIIENNLAQEYFALLKIKESQIIQIQENRETFEWKNGDVALITQYYGEAGGGESSWNTAAQKRYFVVSMKNGHRTLVKDSTLVRLALSPESRFLIYYDPNLKNYFSLDTESGALTNFTQVANAIWYEDDMPGLDFGVYELAGWGSEDNFIYMYDKYDLWKLDPRAKISPVNLTKGVGKRDSIIFRMIHNQSIINSKEKLILTAFDLKSKSNGFYELNLANMSWPKKISMGNYVYYIPTVRIGFPPIKAKYKDLWILRRMSASESPNYFVTGDFKDFIRITNVNPEKRYNWLTSELHSYKLLDGKISQGILYKPENFDSKKKYPIIFYYYQQLSDHLNVYLSPEPSDGRLNISTYVSNGYLVFCPDISYKIGYPGESALNAVSSAVVYLGHFPYVDNLKMGLQGMSWGSFETNYIITHSSLFAAACSTVGQTNLVSYYGGLSSGYNGASNQGYMEDGQGRMGATLWQRPDLYLTNSPVLFAERVKSPVLLMYNKKDGAMYSQGIEFFTALRRLGKKVWMLQYEDGDHSVQGRESDDFNIRMKQFFDHYLKDAPAPIWMTRGIPYKEKQGQYGLELDYSGVQP